MKNIIGVYGSYPKIITSGGNPRINKEMINDTFIKNYVDIIGKLLSIKGKINNLKITYIGGYSNEENISRVKLYISAYNYFLKNLGYDELFKNNVYTLDTKDDINEVYNNICNSDIIFLGIGSDQVFNDNISFLERNNIKLNDIIDKNNSLVLTICSGSVMSGNKIYGGVYDSYYYGKEIYEYPKQINSLKFNPVTMETDFYPEDASREKTEMFIKNYLIPDSNKICFFACRPNSFILTNNDLIYAYGEVYLFIDGLMLQICKTETKVNITNLVRLVNKYNDIKNKKVFIDSSILFSIKKEISKLTYESFDLSSDSEIIDNFSNKEKDILRKRDEWCISLKKNIDVLFKNSNNESFLKENLIKTIEKSFKNYPIYSYEKFKIDLINVMDKYIDINPLVTYYIIEVLGALFENRDLKKILNKLKEVYITDYEKPQKYIDNSNKNLSLFRRYYAKS